MKVRSHVKSILSGAVGSQRGHRTMVGKAFWASFVLSIGAWIEAAPEVVEIHAGNVSELPGGREADGIIGDFVMRNDLVEALISCNAPMRKANMVTFWGPEGATPGCLYDLTFRGEDNDQLTIYSPSGLRGEVSWVREITETDDEVARIEVVRTAARNGGVSVRHVYEMRDGEPGLWILTTFTNESDEAKEISIRNACTQFYRAGRVQGYEWAECVDPRDRVGYAWKHARGSATSTTGKLTVEPGKSIQRKYFFAIGRSPGEAIGNVARMMGGGEDWTVSVKDEAGNPIPDAVVEVTVDEGKPFPVYLSEDGEATFHRLRGEVSFTATAPGRLLKSLTENSAVMGPASEVRFSVTDEVGRDMPCKVQFHGVDGTPSPNLGPRIRAHGCVDQWHSETGKFAVKLAPGKYRLVVTRGPEYGHHEATVLLEEGKTAEVKTKLERQVDTTGWVSADFHNHSTPSGDNMCGIDDRVINMAAEHLEFVPTTEHNRIYDWTPHIVKLGLENEMTTIPGIELTGSGAHLNTFPLTPVPFTQDGGAPAWEKDPRVNAHHLQNLGGWDPKRDQWIQINHPDMSENFIDRNKDKKADGGFLLLDQIIDGVETQNFREPRILSKEPWRITKPLGRAGTRLHPIREFVWLQLLNQGKRIWGVAVADAHTVYGNGTGSWRTYLPSKTDDPGSIDPTEMIRAAKAGKMYLSSGPFLTLGDLLPGQTVAPVDGHVELPIKVQCADWYDIDRVQVLVNGRQVPSLNFTLKENEKMFGDGVVKFEHNIRVPLKEDAHLIVVAIGWGNLEKGFGTSDQKWVRPCVYNNPIFVDVDGNGFQPNGDTLDFELPVGGLSVDEVKAILEEKK